MYLSKAKEEVELYKSVGSRSVPCFKPKADVIPIVICTEHIKRVYYVHLCKDHRKDSITYKPKCKCYITYQDLSEGE